MDFLEWELGLGLTLAVMAILRLAFGFPMDQSYVRMDERLFGSSERGDSAEFVGGLGAFIGVALLVAAFVAILHSPRPTHTGMIWLVAVCGAVVALLSSLWFVFRLKLADWATRKAAAGRRSLPFWRTYHVVLYTVLAGVGVFIGVFVSLRSLGVL